MNSHRVWKTPQDWRKRPEAEVKLPRDPTEAPTGRGSGGMWDSIWMILLKGGVVLENVSLQESGMHILNVNWLA